MRTGQHLQAQYSLSISASTRALVPSAITIFELRKDASFWMSVICAKFEETLAAGK